MEFPVNIPLKRLPTGFGVIIERITAAMKTEIRTWFFLS
jgi:hypothetical protein